MARTIAINGFGRIGRAVFKQAIERSRDFNVVAINDLATPENLAYLLQYDSANGKYNKSVRVKKKGEMHYLIVDDKRYVLYAMQDPTQLPWGDLGVDVVIESTGIFTTKEKAQQHIAAGAKRVVISAPAKDENTPHILMGSNHKTLCKEGLDTVTSNASCTTNAVTPLMAILSESLGVVKSLMTTVHGYTASQSLVDSTVKGDDFLRGRAAAMNIVPSHTGAAKATAKALPHLNDRFDAVAVRVPVIVGSLVDLTVLVEKKTSADAVNALFREAQDSDRWKGILEVSDTPLVSSDIVGNTSASVVDTTYTRVVDGDFIKILAWYDNEWGYTHTLLEHAKQVGNLV